MYSQIFKKKDKKLCPLKSQVKHGNGGDATSHSDTEVVSMSNFTRKKSVKFGTRYMSVEWVKQKFLLEEIDQVSAAGKLCLVEVHKHSNFDEVIASADL